MTEGAEFDLSEYFSSSAQTENYVFEAIYAFDGDVSEDMASVTDGVLTVFGTGTVRVIFKAAGNENYFESDSVVCEFEVVRRNVNLSIDDVTVKYGMPIVFKYTVTDADGDERISYEQLGVTLTPTVSAEDPVCPVPGYYPVSLEAGTVYSECFAVSVSGEAATLTVIKRAVLILPDVETAVSAYGEDIAEIGYEVYEIVDGEPVLAQDVALSGALSITGETVAGYYPVGEYPITTGSITAENGYPRAAQRLFGKCRKVFRRSRSRTRMGTQRTGRRGYYGIAGDLCRRYPRRGRGRRGCFGKSDILLLQRIRFGRTRGRQLLLRAGREL